MHTIVGDEERAQTVAELEIETVLDVNEAVKPE